MDVQTDLSQGWWHSHRADHSLGLAFYHKTERMLSADAAYCKNAKNWDT